MKALILSSEQWQKTDSIGSKDVTARIIEELLQSGWEVTLYSLVELEISPCMGCFQCWVRTPGVCVMKDAGERLPQAWVQSELVVLITPVSFGGYSYHLKKALDRMIPILSPFFIRINGEVHHKRRYKRYPSVLAIGLLPASDQFEAGIFRNLVERNALNWHSPRHEAIVTDGSKTSEYIQVLHDINNHKELLCRN